MFPAAATTTLPPVYIARWYAATERRLRKSAGCDAPEDPPEAIAQAIASMRAYFAGEPVDFSAIALDLATVPAFNRKVYEAARRVGFGHTVSYGALAHELGYTGDTNDTATMNIWLHKQVIEKLAANGGSVPVDLQ